ncbi:shikimate kinase [Blautia liquoris]|uniref:Shikimate kinase n=1 Tax=Blautia liquoris TaxID=2779518 RepID=A0A7M2RGH3_9FIRM|nr:shikimate kinase [Blautia liquoris]QOV19446.1 shikimate kinase [Blautia liquoris]
MIKNIVLIGMPGVGKSTVGVILAKELGYNFVDSDLIIQTNEKRLLSEIIEQEGIDGFLKIENQVNASLCVQKAVIATGGSVVYGYEAMEHLKKIGNIIYLKLSYQELEKRLDNLEGRGVVVKSGQTLRNIYDERTPIYEKYANHIIDEENLDIEKTLQKIVEVIGN